MLLAHRGATHAIGDGKRPGRIRRLVQALRPSRSGPTIPVRSGGCRRAFPNLQRGTGRRTRRGGRWRGRGRGWPISWSPGSTRPLRADIGRGGSGLARLWPAGHRRLRRRSQSLRGDRRGGRRRGDPSLAPQQIEDFGGPGLYIGRGGRAHPKARPLHRRRCRRCSARWCARHYGRHPRRRQHSDRRANRQERRGLAGGFRGISAR